MSTKRYPDFRKVIGNSRDIAYVSGSQQAGLSNDRSDLDLYIISDYEEGNSRTKSGTVIPEVREVDGYIVDVERYSYSFASSVINKVNDWESSGSEILSLKDVSFYFRIAQGVPVQAAGLLEKLRTPCSIETASKALVAIYGERARVAMREAEHFYRAGAPRRAYVKASYAVRAAAATQAARRGIAYPGEKFAFLKLARALGPSSRELSRLWLAKALPAKTDIAQYLAEVTSLLREFGLLDVGHLLGSIGHPRRSDESAEMWRIDGSSFIVTSTAIHEVTPAAAEFWSRVDGRRSVADILAELVEGNSGVGWMSRTTLKDASQDLVRAGLIVDVAETEAIAPAAVHVVSLPETPAEFARRRAMSALAGALYSARSEDTIGAIEASLPELAFVSSLAALEIALVGFLGMRGVFVDDLSGLFDDPDAFPNEVSVILQQTWELMSHNPLTKADVYRHAERCLAFAEEELRVQAVLPWGSLQSTQRVGNAWMTWMERSGWPAWLLADKLGVLPEGYDLSLVLDVARGK